MGQGGPKATRSARHSQPVQTTYRCHALVTSRSRRRRACTGGETTAPKGSLPKAKCKPPSNKPSNVPRKPSSGLDSLAWGEPRVVVIESSALATSLDRRAGGGGAGPSVRISRGYHAACGYAAERKAIVLGSLDAADRGAPHRRSLQSSPSLPRRPSRVTLLRCRGSTARRLSNPHAVPSRSEQPRTEEPPTCRPAFLLSTTLR
jgi:hypothetical protein